MAGKEDQKKRFWSDEEKISICVQSCASRVSVAQVARRYAMNANLIHKWLRDPKFAPDPEHGEAETVEASCFLLVEIIDQRQNEGVAPVLDAKPVPSAIEVDIAGGHQLRIIDSYDPVALARLIRGLSV